MKKPFFARHALLVLIVVFFFVPFAMRGSRYAVQCMKNDVKDWLPTDFPETQELDWFRQQFLGEQFVVVSWDGCHGKDDSFRLFVDKLLPELPPSAIRGGEQVPRREQYVDAELGLYTRAHMPEDPQQVERFIGNRLSLRTLPEVYLNWGGRQEKWLRSGKDEWVFITPQGDLYQWKANHAWPAKLWRAVRRLAVGSEPVEGEFLASLGATDGPWYYTDPRRLNARYFKSVTTGPSVLSELTREDGPLAISPEEAHNRLRGVLFGPDDRQTCIVVTLTDAGKEDPRGVLGRGMLGKPRGALLDIAEASGIQPPAAPPMLPAVFAWLAPQAPTSRAPLLRLGGPPVDNAAIDEEGQITLVRLLGLSLLVGLGLSWVCFRSINITLMVFLVGGISAVTSVGIVYWSGSTVDAVLMSMPSLVYVLGISGAVHIVNYYRESVAEHGLSTAPGNAVKLGWAPCTLAAITTSLGLISLSASNIIPIRKFGIYSAVGVVATLTLLFTYLPAALEIWPPRRFLMRAAKSGADHATTAIERLLDSFWQSVGRWVIGHYRFVGISCFLLTLIIGYGLTRIDTSIQLLKLFDGDATIIRDYQWYEANLGKLVPMEIVVKVAPELRRSSLENSDTQAQSGTPADESLKLSFFERMQIAKYAGEEIERIFGEQGNNSLGRPMSASTFAPTPDFGSTALVRAGTKEAYGRRLEENRDAFVEADFLRIDPEDDSELWRISLRLAALSDIKFGEFVQQTEMVLEPMLAAYKYRETILRRLVAAANNKRIKRVVYLVGFPNQRHDASPSSAHGELPEIDQTKIFSRTLLRLLKDERVSVRELLPARVSKVQQTDGVVILQKDPQLPVEDLADVGAFQLDATGHRFDPERDRTAEESGLPVSAVYTGLVPVVYKAQRTLLESLIQSTGLAFVMIAGVMILILRSPRAGLISMLPNVFPVVAIFGIMGWTRVLVDIGSMMTASVAMGVAVDDTIHFLSWFRRGLDEGSTRQQAILLAYRRVATAMTQTTAIGGIGLSVFAFSTFTPTQRFGTLMLALLAAALVGDLLFLPALLASPLGKVFDNSRRKTEPEPSHGLAAPHVGTKRGRSRSSLPATMRRDDSHR